MIIRHEINIINREVEIEVSGAYIYHPELIHVDKAAYSGSIAVYLEAVYKRPSAINNFLLQISNNDGDMTPRLTYGIFGSQQITYLRWRDSDCSADDDFDTPCEINWSAYSIGDQSAYINALRLIIIQDTSTDPLTASETQIEIGDYETQIFTSTATEPLAYPKYWYFDENNWDGTLEIYGEVVWSVENNKYTADITIQEDDGNFGNWADVVTIVDTGASEDIIRTRSADFSAELTTGRHYRLAVATVGTKAAYSCNIFSAKLVIVQTDVTAITKLEEQYLLVNTGQDDTGLQDFDQLYDADEWDGVTVELYPEHDASPEDYDYYSYPESNFDQNYSVGQSGALSAMGQTFTTTSENYLSTATFYLRGLDTPSGSCYAALFDTVAGVPDGAAIAISDAIDSSTIPTGSQNLIDFVFSTPYLMSDVTVYAIAFEYSAGDYVSCGADESSPGHAGSRVWWNGSWIEDATNDTIFYINREVQQHETKIQEDPNGTPADVSDSSITGANQIRGGTALTITDDEEIDSYIVTV